jgi:hypothetical protein
MLNKFLLSASVAGLIAGSALAVGLENLAAPGGASANEVYPLADELDFDGGSVSGTLQVGFGPSAGSFPTGNVLVYLTVAGATFDGALTGAEVGGVATSVISSGGASGGNTVAFLVSGANTCLVDASAAGFETDCDFNIPLELTGSDVSFSVGLTTDAGAPIDNTSSTTFVTRKIISLNPAFAINVVADTVETKADLNSIGGPFLGFTGPSDNTLGTIEVAANEITQTSGTYTVNVDLASTAVSSADVDSVDVTVTGVMDAFEGGDFEYDGTSFDAIVAATDIATYDAVLDFGTVADIDVTEDGTTPIARSSYSAAVTVTPDAGSNLIAGTAKSGALQSIERNGTTITFPWTQTSTLGATSGTTSVYRIGNLDAVAAGAVFVEVKNATTAGYTNPGIIELAASIAASGELVSNSGAIEAAVGNYGRGDIEFTIEADPETLTARQFVVRNGVIQQVIGGNVDQDINN